MVKHRWHHVLKSKFLEGKHNHHLDHLLHVLLDLVVPYYIGRSRRQEFGFEGPDLEVKKRQEITQRALTISKDLVTEIIAGEAYRIKSQSANHYYQVNLDAYTCECLSYPLINFCKHLCAVQNYFSMASKTQEIFTCNTEEMHHLRLTTGTSPPDTSDDDSEVDGSLNEMEKISDLVDKLQHLSVRTRLQRPLHLTPKLEILSKSLDDVLQDLGYIEGVEQVLPKHKRVAPNQRGRWRETAEVMGARIKTTHISKHTDPYSAREASGKRAQADAKQPLKRRKLETRYLQSIQVTLDTNSFVSMSANNPSVNAPFGTTPAIPSPLKRPITDLDILKHAPHTVTPQATWNLPNPNNQLLPAIFYAYPPTH